MDYPMLSNLTLTLAQGAPPADAPAPPPSVPAPPPSVPTGPGPVTNQTVQPGAPGGQTPPAAGSPFTSFPVLMIVLLVVMWFLLIMPQRKEKKRRAALLAAIKKGDRVQMMGGMIGTVVELRDHDVILKVDENTNTRIKFVRGAIDHVVQESQESKE